MDHILKAISDENGHLLSPVLNQNIKNYLIDIDGTICEDVPNEEPERMVDAMVFPNAIDYVNNLYNEGHIIYFFTSRTENLRDITEVWLQKHDFKYHGIIFGKPRGGNYHWIDNHIVRATRYMGKFTELVKVQREIEVFED